MMADRIETQPSKETVAARKSLKAGIAQLLRQRRDLSFNNLAAKGCGFEVTLNFQEGDGRRGVPSPVVDFIDSQYPGRSVGLSTVHYHYHKGGVTDGWNRTTSEWETTVIEIETAHLETKGGLEAEKNFKDVIIPGQDIVRSTRISLLLYEDPISYFVSDTSMREWITGDRNTGTGRRPSVEEKHVLKPEIVLALTSLLPDQPSTTPLLDKIADCLWLPVAMRVPFHELRRKKLFREDPNLERSRDLPNKSIVIYC